MRHLTWVLALASFAGVASAQQPDTSVRRTPDPGGLPLAPDCVRPTPLPPGVATPDSVCLTREAALAAAATRNPQIRAALEQVAQARARRVQGISIPDPQFDVEFNEATGLFGGGAATDRIVGTTIQIPFPDKFRLRGRIGRADVRSTEASLQALRQGIAAATSQVYDSLLAALRHQHDLEQAKSLADDFLKKTDARFQGGSAARLDLIRARVEVAQAENDLITNSRDIVNARAALNRLIDRPLGAPLAVSDSLVLPPPLPGLEALEAAAFESRPELAGLQREQEGAKAATALAREYWLPDVIFGISKNYADPGPGLLSTGISLPLPVFFWQHTKGEIAESHHRELELAAFYRDLRAQVGQDVRSAYAAASTAQRQAVFLRDVLLPAAREAYRIASVSYGLGGASPLEVLDTRRVLREAESQYTDALAAASMARADLQRAVGAPLERFEAGGSRGQ
jgi:cobalt-zinc-cadmium efflux system outer membrane protein